MECPWIRFNARGQEQRKKNKYKFVGKITINKRLKFKASSTAYNFALPFVTARS